MKERVYKSKFRKCTNCYVTSTPLWRKSVINKALLCNACSLYEKAHGKPRSFFIGQQFNLIKKNSKKTAKNIFGSEHVPAVFLPDMSLMKFYHKNIADGQQNGTKSKSKFKDTDRDRDKQRKMNFAHSQYLEILALSGLQDLKNLCRNDF
ncbi:hypothetical protein ENBRE01_0105 [Enteropsectra breve]|nr:hypothetical protein ENBRE01_0105 [Enteropsectra breve]